MSSDYWKTWCIDRDGKSEVHLSEGGDAAICGCDLCGDDSVHAKQPEALEGKPRITCPHCLQLIETVKRHLKRI